MVLHSQGNLLAITVLQFSMSVWQVHSPSGCSSMCACRLAEWVVAYYPIPVAIGMFMLVSGLLLAAFLIYQAVLISRGRTTYEVFKRNQLHKQLKEAAAAAEAVAQTAARSQGNRRPLTQRLQRLSSSKQQTALSPNAYDRGLFRNWFEVLFPERFLQHCSRKPNQAPSKQLRRGKGAAAKISGRKDS
eukprot:GHRR01033817.1.p1 GENE.GHRR01033817.1~~GHRR01033817.1.p1  ORF type:complete len:188 (-),score=52.90 GHRR01033817.1:133-696(-)